MNIRFAYVLWSLLLLAMAAPVAAAGEEDAFPRTLQLENGSVTIYPMQAESLEGQSLRYRAALAYQAANAADPVFGAGWFQSRVEIDRTKGTVHPLDLSLTDIRFPEGTVDIQAELGQAIARQSPGWNLDFPLNELLSSLEAAEQEAKTVQNLNTAPPTILYRDHPALLVTIDGEPVLRAIENSPYQAVVNTPYPLIFDKKNYYLSAADGVWYRAAQATGPYRYDANPPADIVAMVEKEAPAADNSEPAEKVTAANAPEIVVATTPTELIVTDGPAAFVPLVDDLLVLDNSDDDVFMHISSQQYYVVLAGRWYHASTLNGPWTWQAADQLPVAFADIPKTSDQADARVYVAGTEEAREAVLDAQIPQTAAVDRGTVDIDVTYDGDPRFEPVEGTNLTYADNTASTVIKSDRVYYLVEDGVWYVSYSPNGPWEVSDYRPEEVAAISPESPVYNVKYVYVYDSTPEVVYVGYTPGYIGSYVYGPTIVYGTGWYYRPWISPYYYYPRYSTWGFNVGYSPWYGWNFGLSWSWGPFYAGWYSGGYWHGNRYGYNPYYYRWGPVGYRPRPAPYYRYGHGYGYGYGKGGHDRHRYGNGRYGDNRHGRGGYGDNRYGRGGHDDNGYGRGGRGEGRYGRNGYENAAYAGSGSPRGATVRNRNLYRDQGQRAHVADAGAGPARSRGAAGRNGADNLASRGQLVGDAGRSNPADNLQGKSGRSRTGLVTPSDLQVKAQVRDTKRDAQRGRLVANPVGKASRNGRVSPQPRTGKVWESASAAREVRPARSTAENSAGTLNTHTARQQNGTQQRGAQKSASPQNAPVARAPRQGSSQPNSRQASSRTVTAPVSGTPRQSGTRRAVERGTTQSRNSPVAPAPRQGSTTRAVQQANTQARNAPIAPAPRQSTSRRATQRQATAPRGATVASAQQRSAPSRSSAPAPAQRQSAPQGRAPAPRTNQRQATPRQSAPQGTVQRQSAPAMSAPPQSAPQRSAPKQSAPRQQSQGSRGSREGNRRNRGNN